MSEMMEKIQKFREYLNYLEEHYASVQSAWKVLRSTAFQRNLTNVGLSSLDFKFTYDDLTCAILDQEVEKHDLSKLSAEEFFIYREEFFPIASEVKPRVDENGQKLKSEKMGPAWEHHKDNNMHHWQTWTKLKFGEDKIIHAVHNFVDWYAMSMKFGGRPLDYYRKNKETIHIDKYFINMFDSLERTLVYMGIVN